MRATPPRPTGCAHGSRRTASRPRSPTGWRCCARPVGCGSMAAATPPATFGVDAGGPAAGCRGHRRSRLVPAREGAARRPLPVFLNPRRTAADGSHPRILQHQDTIMTTSTLRPRSRSPGRALALALPALRPRHGRRARQRGCSSLGLGRAAHPGGRRRPSTVPPALRGARRDGMTDHHGPTRARRPTSTRACGSPGASTTPRRGGPSAPAGNSTPAAPCASGARPS